MDVSLRSVKLMDGLSGVVLPSSGDMLFLPAAVACAVLFKLHY